MASLRSYMLAHAAVHRRARRAPLIGHPWSGATAWLAGALFVDGAVLQLIERHAHRDPQLLVMLRMKKLPQQLIVAAARSSYDRAPPSLPPP